jgi:ligand-binding SRPBCC domain-containing protein
MIADHTSTYTLHRRQHVAAPVRDVFAFLANAATMQFLLPPWLHYALHTPLPVELRTDAYLDSSFRWRLLNYRWRSQVLDWSPPRRFVYRQLAGPFKLWEHVQLYDPQEQGTLITDHVRYAMPFGVMGRCVHSLVVRHDLEALFDYRRQRITDRFGAEGGNNEDLPLQKRGPSCPPKAQA